MATAPNFGDIKRGDAGRDGGGIYRNIARETRIPNILTKGDYSTLDWPDICRNFWTKSTEERLQVNMVDTIVLNKGEVVMYLYTNMDGYISKKPKALHSMQKIRDEFCGFLDNLQPTSHKYVAIAHYAGRLPFPIDIENFNSICMGATPADLELLQVFVPSKGNPTTHSTFKTDYWLDRNARPILKTVRVGVRQDVSGSKNKDTTASMNRSSNTMMETYCRRVVNRIQENLQCKVVRMSLTFVEDAHGKIWLTQSTECLYAVEKITVNRSMSPENRKLARTTRLTNGEGSDEEDDQGYRINSSNGALRPSHTVAIGRNSDKRIHRRAARTEELLHTDLGVVESILNQPTRKLSPVRKVRLEQRGGYTDFLGHTQPPGTATLSRLATPVEVSGLLAPKPLDPAVLGTSQTEGCPGDFCHFDLSFIENHEVSSSSNGVDMGHNRTDLSDFRKRLLATNAAGVDDIDEMASLASSGAFQSGSLDVSHRKGHVKETKHIPFRIIVQARQEMPLVNRLMRKIRRGDDGRHGQLTHAQRMELDMYVTEDNYNDLAISSKLPSHYYRDVACCETCFKVYKIITDARAAAIKFIEKKKDKSKKKKRGHPLSLDGGRNGSSYDLSSMSENYVCGSELENSQHFTSREIDKQQSLNAALQAIESLTKLDVAEIRTMSKPPAAVEVVMEAVMVLLTGKVLSFQECRRLLGGGEAFLLMLREFQLENVTDTRLKLVEPYVDNPVFRPENVLPISFCASKFCAWVLGVVQAARWQRGQGHKRSNLLPADSSYSPEKRPRPKSRHEIAPYEPNSSAEDLTFQEKLERKKARSSKKTGESASNSRSTKNIVEMTSSVEGSGSAVAMFAEFNKKPKPSHNYISRSLEGAVNRKKDNVPAPPPKVHKSKETLRREQVAMVASQKRSVDRLSSLTQEGHTSATGIAKDFRCYDGITKMSYIVLGNLSLDVSRVNFIVVHDFFDTCDATAITFKPIVQRHDGCQVFCFNYPGQANTVWPRPSAAERERGASEQILNNDWIADRLHELLQHAEGEGDILLTNPFHIVGIGNGAAIASSFALKYGSEKLYAGSLRSLVAINGILYPDPQLSSILHSASQVFESSPHSRPDIPISYWSRFVFSEDYLSRINPNLALNIYTAVSNPITNDGRTKIARGCLKHKDMRGMLNPDALPKKEKSGNDDSDSEDGSEAQMRPLTVPVIILQSTENMLVNASNVDGFLSGRAVKHLWSHQQNVVTAEALVTASDYNASWVGKLCNGPIDYAKFSLLGRTGLKMLLDCIENPRGAFVMWTRAGHAIQQENKTAVLDLFDALACPMESYYGLSKAKEKPSTDYMTNIIELEMKKSKPVKSKKEENSDDELDFGDDSSDFNDKDEDHADNDGDEEIVLFEIQAPEKTSHPPSIPSPEPSPRVEELEGDEKAEERVDSKDDVPTRSAPKRRESGKDSADPIVSSEVESDSEVCDVSSQAEVDVDVKEVFTAKPALHDKVCDDDDDDENTIIEKLVAPAPNARRPEELRADPTVIKKDTNQPDLPKTATHVGEHKTVLAQSKKPLPNPVDELIEESSSKELKGTLDTKFQATIDSNEAIRKKKAEDEAARLRRIEEDQAFRRQQFQKEDDKLLAKLDSELDERRKERERAERLRRLELQNIEQKLIDRGIVDEYKAQPGDPGIIKELPDMKYNQPAELPSVFTESKDTVSQLDRMIADEEDARKKGIMSMEQYEQVKAQMIVAQINRDQKTRHMEVEEQTQFLDDCARLIQRVMRGHVGRIKAARAAKDRQLKKTIEKGVKVFQAVVRGMIGRRRAVALRRIHLANLLRGDSIINIQRIIRGFIARKYYRKLRRFVAARNIQRTFRGHVGRMTANRERQRLLTLRRKEIAATKIESTWRMKVAKEEFRSLRIQMLAAIEIQRWYRGYLGRKIMNRRREWESATPGPERIKLGLRMIEESKVAFERQQEEIDALHRAQERAEARVSHIHAELKESEKELVILERELQEIDQIERDLQIMTHERDVLTSEIKDAAGMPRSALPGHENTLLGLEPGLLEESSDSIRRKKAEAYALELTIQIKRAEREKKRQELETEFASVFQEVEKKRKALERLESSLADMESTRERKDREFRRLQKNLMQLLLEQKQELDDLREKGIELETATATTAAAATATAQKAKEHEKRSTAMFSQTEELMKFQFMSMSLSYFSSLNMLKQLRDMNSDTTSAAVTSSADAAAAAAAAATAANLPSMKKLNLGADDFVSLNIQKKKLELEAANKAEKEVKSAKSAPMPTNVHMWSVDDVVMWLETLSLGQYCSAFREATVDGPFLMELREEDLVQVLGVEHKLHVRKIMVSREKLKPLTAKQMAEKEQVEHEDMAETRRKMVGVPDLDTVFSQARNGRLKRLEESLNLGFPVDTEDAKGNTLLLVACQNCNRRMAEMLCARGAAINHQNAQGNTPLHFAMSFDTEGLLAEYLIQNGADDTIENVDGLTPYDGVK